MNKGGLTNNEQGMTIGEGKVVRGDGVKSIVRIIQFTYSLINEFPNKRITIGEVAFLMPGTTKIANKTAPWVRPFSSPGFQPGVCRLAIKNLEVMGEINGWSGIERSIPSAP